MTSLLLVIGLLFTPTIAALGSPAWPVREAAARRLVNAWPLSIGAVQVAAQSPDPEIRRLADAVTQAGLNRATRQATANLVAHYVWSDHESDGLPYAPIRLHEELAKNTMACRLLANWAAHTGDMYRYWFQGTPYQYWLNTGITIDIYELDVLRFKVRGLTPPNEFSFDGSSPDIVRKEWAEIKRKRKQ